MKFIEYTDGKDRITVTVTKNFTRAEIAQVLNAVSDTVKPTKRNIKQAVSVLLDHGFLDTWTWDFDPEELDEEDRRKYYAIVKRVESWR